MSSLPASMSSGRFVASNRCRARLLAGGVMVGLMALWVGSSNAQTAKPAPANPVQQRAAAPKTAVAATADNEIVARMGARDISVGEVRAFLANFTPEQRAALAKDPAAVSQTLRSMLASQLLLKEANEKKWAEQPQIASQLERLRDNAIVETYLASVSVPPANYPDEQEIETTYDANKSAFIVPRQYRLAQIYVGLPTGADKATEEQATKKVAAIQAKLKQKADFAAVAKELSDQRETADNGGDLGWVMENQLLPEIKAQAGGLAVGAFGEPLKLADGYHIIKLVETKAAQTRPISEVRDVLVQRLRAQRTEMMRRAYLARALEQNPAVVNELALSKVVEATVQPTR